MNLQLPLQYSACSKKRLKIVPDTLIHLALQSYYNSASTLDMTDIPKYLNATTFWLNKTSS